MINDRQIVREITNAVVHKIPNHNPRKRVINPIINGLTNVHRRYYHTSRCLFNIKSRRSLVGLPKSYRIVRNWNRTSLDQCRPNIAVYKKQNPIALSLWTNVGFALHSVFNYKRYNAISRNWIWGKSRRY